jgi:siroheme synthase
MLTELSTVARNGAMVAAVAALSLAFAAPTFAGAACVVTQDVFDDHIDPRHCDPNQFQNKSKFLVQYCTRAAAEQFCRSVQNSGAVTRVVQPDNRVRFDAELGIVVGTAGEKCGRVVITSAADGTVVTQFPELAGPGLANCS